MKRGPLVCLLFSMSAVCYGGDDVCVRHLVVPGFPRLARMARLQGPVTIEIEIGEDGKVVSAKASGVHRLLERASEENIRQWTFRPATLTGSPISRQLRITYTYKLVGKEQYDDPPPYVVFDLPHRVEITSRPPEPQPAAASGRR